MADTKYAVTVDSTGAVKQIEELDKAWERLKKSGQGVEEKAGTLEKVFSSLISKFTAASLASRAIEGAWSKIKGFTADSIRGALEDEAVQRRLVTALERTGRARNEGVKDLSEYATQQAKVTTYSVNEIKAAETMLAQMTKLDNEGIKNVTKGVIGLAATLGPDEGGLEGATSRVVRALNGNAEGLSRVGIEIDTNLPKAQQLIQVQQKLLELYPRATAELETDAGRIKQAGKEWEEFRSKLGAVALQTFNVGQAALVGAELLETNRREARLSAETYKELAKSTESWTRASGGGAMYRDYMTSKKAIEDNKEAISDWLATLKYVKPPLQEIHDALLNGGWDKYKAGIEEADATVQKYAPQWEKIFKKIGDWLTPKGIKPPLFDLKEASKDLGVVTEEELKPKLEEARQALDAYLNSAHPAPGIAEAWAKKVRELEAAYKGANFELSKSGHLVQPKFNLGSSFQNIEPVVEQNNIALGKYKTLLGSLYGDELGRMIDGMGEYAGAGENVVEVQNKINEAWTYTTRIQIGAKVRELKKELDHMLGSGDATAEEIQRLREEIKRLQDQLNKKVTASWVTKLQDSFAGLQSYVSAITSGLDSIFQQSASNREIAIDNEYKKRLAIINKTIKDEDKKQKAIEALEAEYEIKRSSAKAASAKQAKAVALAEAIWNTSRAITEALPNLILAAIVGAMGAVQIGTIAAQPIPLAKGGILRKPVFSQGFEAGEAGPEVVAPLSDLPRLVRNLNVSMAGAAAGASFTMNINSPLISTSGLSDADLAAAGTKLMRIVRSELERVGKRRW